MNSLRMGKITLGFALIVMTVVFYACTSSIPHSDTLHQQWAIKNMGNIDLHDARKLYTESCSGCHALHSPSEFTRKEWSSIIAVMAVKARLSSRDSVAVTAYLDAYSRDNHLSLR
ncbi:MAG: hypothetical protein ABI778_06760 [Ignavibacteriota bacterium]